MAIYRGTGGAGDATTDATVTDVTEQAVIATNKASEAAASATAAANSASSASSSATAAANSATNAASVVSGISADAAAAEAAKLAAQAAQAAAETAETNAETAETNAETAETNAAASASSASTSATTATTQAGNASTSASNAAASETAASTSASSAATSATSAAASAGTATTKASEASSSATAAAGSATAAATSATAASSSATDAQTAQTAAEAAQTAAEAAEAGVAADATAAASSASAAATSESNAAASASAASTSETNAATSESNAATSATAASGSATAAASSASAASTSETNAATSATNASASETAASASETAAASSATSASTSATNAATSESNASTSASAAATSASNASTSESNAATSASNASTSESNAASSATAAAGSATAAAGSASAASASADAALSALDNFDDRYLGQKATAPTVDNDGDALVTGALYFDTTDDAMKVWDGSQWLNAYASLSGALIANNNLSDLTDAATARTNLGLGTAATTNSTAYATAAQGSTADSALQSGDNISLLTNNSGYITGNQTITLSGDVSGSGTTSIAVTIADDSHNHIISNVDGLQAALDGKVDDSQVLTNVPAGAVFTDTTYSVGNGGLTEINFTSALNSKLAGIESGATADQTASEILTAVKTVDGSGSGLDADLLDGQQGSYYQPASTAWTVMGNSPSDLNNAGQGLWRINASEANRPSGVDWGTLLSFDNVADTGFQLASDYQGSSFYWRASNAPVYGGGGAFSPWRRIWHDGNDGSGSGLDADLLDGQQGSYYAAASSLTGYLSNAYLNGRTIADANSADGAGVTAYYLPNTASNSPEGTDHSLLTLSYSSEWSTQLASDWRTNNWYVRNQNNTTWASWQKLWHSGNDGSGSGLDADLLDGVHASGFVTQLGDTTSPNYLDSSSRRVDPNASNPTNEHYAVSTFGNEGNVSGQLATHFVNGQAYTRGHNNSWSAWRKQWDNLNDGSGSGLDADLLDGQHGSYFYSPANIPSKIKAGGTGPSTENLNTVADSVPVGQLEYRGFNSSSSNAPPVADNANGVITVGQHGGDYNAQLAFSSNGNMYWRDNPGAGYGSWRTIWDNGNDGSGSGLDADLLDGQHASAFGKAQTASLGSSGWWKCNDTGLIIQWGSANPGTNYTTVTFPIAFPSVCMQASAHVYRTGSGSANPSWIYSFSRTSANVYSYYHPADNYRWIAYGY